ncbi:MAG TPA: glycine cleavage system protein GcvH, partial [Ignavibacteriaceae bacterium]|nr:glycine cleavage system protein GcvH [Ignavibacteriaceae bacterium]
MNFPENLKYTKDHEWIKLEKNIGLIGITEYAQGELGDVVFVDIDPSITQITKGNSFGTIEAVKTVSDIYAPCTGKIVEINKDLTDNPEFVNNDPYGKGWMVKVELQDVSELNDLLDSSTYKNLIGQ